MQERPPVVKLADCTSVRMQRCGYGVGSRMSEDRRAQFGLAVATNIKTELRWLIAGVQAASGRFTAGQMPDGARLGVRVALDGGDHLLGRVTVEAAKVAQGARRPDEIPAHRPSASR